MALSKTEKRQLKTDFDHMLRKDRTVRILFVEQLGKKNWEYVYSAAKYIARSNEVICYMSDSTPRIDRPYDFKIVYGFHGAYEGSCIHKAIHYMIALIELKNYIKDNAFDVVHFEWFSIPWVEWAYIRSLKKYAKIVITVNDVIPFNERPFERQSLAQVYKQADAILLHTDPALRLFDDVYKIDNRRAVITAAFRDWKDYTRIDKEEARDKLDIPENKIVVLYFGTIRESKGLDILIKAMPEAIKKNPDLFLLAAGEFHKVKREAYEELINKDLDPSYSKLVFEHIPDDEMKYYFSAADILILPYREIYQSGIAQFGLIYGLPIIGADIPRLADMVVDGANGVVFQREDYMDLADKMAMLSLDSEKMSEYAARSHEMAVAHFSVEERAARTLEIYKEIVKE